MTSLRNVLLLTFLSAVLSFTPTIPSTHSTRTLSSSPLFGLAAPQTITKTKTITKSKSKSDSKQKQKETFKVYQGEPETQEEEAPLWMVFLIGDEKYKQTHVTTRLTQIIPEVNDKIAIDIFEAAQKTGEGLCGKFDAEVAELYAEQLTRSDPIIFAEARPEKKDD